MNIEEIKKYVEQNTSGEAFFVQVRPEDCLSRFYLYDDDCIIKVNQAMPDKYKGKMVGLKKDLCNGRFTPVFDEETQQEWDKELNDYITRKAAWCEKHGCE